MDTALCFKGLLLYLAPPLRSTRPTPGLLVLTSEALVGSTGVVEWQPTVGKVHATLMQLTPQYGLYVKCKIHEM